MAQPLEELQLQRVHNIIIYSALEPAYHGPVPSQDFVSHCRIVALRIAVADALAASPVVGLLGGRIGSRYAGRPVFSAAYLVAPKTITRRFIVPAQL